ncbi:uncharacterized protein LOC135491302 isoform X2 [Lineus longissimus]|uniref:uncharacterized protein LOC135491302 isoform X2 n=1 Tax=Lineus longissimus TaxID=88925 RepID=UPI002B4C8E25
MTDLVEFVNSVAVWQSQYLKGEHSVRHVMENRDSPGKELPTKTQRQLRSQNRQGMTEQLNFDEDHQNMVNNKKCTCTQTAGTQTSYNYDQYEVVRKQLSQSAPSSSQTNHATEKTTTTLQDMPLNLTMSVQDDPQTIPTYTQLRPSVIKCAPNMPPLSPGGSTGSSLPSSPSPTSPNGPSKREVNSVGICDPAIDEHFRRSLGKNYPAPPEYLPAPAPAPAVLPNPTQSQPELSVTGSVDDHFAKSLGQKWTEIKAKNDNLDLDISIGSVDDHFAKALGDTWHKIKAQHDGCKNSACSSPPSSPASSVVST